jgi:uncharacterized 2Fe-2S/4Fe-4S cluster protein (DUF4445 family)
MQHLVMGVSPASIAFAPFTPEFTDARTVAAADLHLGVHENAVVEILPSVSGYVGADIVAGIASTYLADQEDFTLFIDIGTNGEVVLGNRDTIYCCATAAGPAFEGANIECGIGAVEGAISEFYQGTYLTIGHGPPVGICGSGLVDLVAHLLNSGVINDDGFMEKNHIIERAENTPVRRDIYITPQDVRKVQLAKAAIFAGIRVLMQVADVSYDRIKNVYLAGGFGNYINFNNAVKIGLLPAELRKKITPIGNSAGTGARFALKSVGFSKHLDEVLQKSTYLELSMREDFNIEYINAMRFSR